MTETHKSLIEIGEVKHGNEANHQKGRKTNKRGENCHLVISIDSSSLKNGITEVSQNVFENKLKLNENIYLLPSFTAIIKQVRSYT